MKNLFNTTDSILNSPYTNMFLALVFLYTSVNSIIDDYQSDIKGIGIHHGIALYGLVMFFKSILSTLQSVSKMKKAHDEIRVKVVDVKEKIEDKI
jgi:hypothetical protein